MTGGDAFQSLYLKFENEFRGSKELIRGRLLNYLPLIAQIDSSVPNARSALDIGSGRGEWLEILQENGWQAVGVDSNESMVSSADQQGLRTVRGDALEFLQKQSSCSFGLVTAFHVVEHVDRGYLARLLYEIERVLTPGGMVILETPNPENLTVATWSFHLDPTHIRPIPPDLLQFYVKTSNFVASQVLRLNGSGVPNGVGELEELMLRLFTSGPDYSVVALKNNSSGMAQAIDSATLPLEPSAADRSALLRIAHTLDNRVNRTATELHDLSSKLHDLNEYIRRIHESRSWKITQPLRDASGLFAAAVSFPRRHIRALLESAIRLLSKNPRWKYLCLRLLRYSPAIRNRLESFANARGYGAVAQDNDKGRWNIDAPMGSVAKWELLLKNKNMGEG